MAESGANPPGNLQGACRIRSTSPEICAVSAAASRAIVAMAEDATSAVT